VRAVVYHHYGGPDVLEVVDLEEPKMAQDSVVVGIRAAGVNPADTALRRGAMAEAMDAYFPVIPGWDLAGVVERVGAGVHELSVGDEVIGYVRQPILRYGTYAETISTPVSTLVRKPSHATWVQAAGLPLCGLTAYQAIAALRVEAGETVLVHGGAGGVGSLAVQIALARGARIIAAGAEANHDFLRSLGAEPVHYDDRLVGEVRALAPDGVHAVLDAAGRGALTATPSLAHKDVRVASIADLTSYPDTIAVFARMNLRDLAAVVDLVDEGKLTVRIAKTFPLEEAADAQRLVESGRAHGKVVLAIDT
jgi:NADPH:quinone reductase-like Zn-dependent oxidoreductase